MTKKSILVADSGGTKTDWIVGCDAGDARIIRTEGLNPNMLSQDSIVQILHREVVPSLRSESIQSIYFFGAGLGLPDNRNLLKLLITQAFPKVSDIHVATDLLGAAHAGLGFKSGIVAILGTGSAAVRYDGTKIQQRCGGWGYLFGDDGSGITLGKSWIRLYLEERLPETLMDAFEKSISMGREEILRKIYIEKIETDFFARQAQFLSQHQDYDFVRQFLTRQFELFCKSTLEPCLCNCPEKIVFVGSIAENFFPIISSVCHVNDMHPCRLLPSPIIRPLLEHVCKLSEEGRIQLR